MRVYYLTDRTSFSIVTQGCNLKRKISLRQQKRLGNQMPNARRVDFGIPKECALTRYAEQLVIVFNQPNYEECFNNFTNRLFKDCFAFVRKELQMDAYPEIALIYVYNELEYKTLEKQSNWIYQKERPTGETGAFVTTSEYGNTIYLNFEPLLALLREKPSLVSAFIFNFVLRLVHEILHCFYVEEKSEQEIHEIQFRILETFFGIKLPDIMKKEAVSGYYRKDF